VTPDVPQAKIDPPATRTRNRRGEGKRLREEIVRAATELLTELGDVNLLSLRAVAREVGITTTSIYPHFKTIEELAGAVVAHAFEELDAARDAASESISDADDALLARSQAYCRFAISRPGLYRVMFQVNLPDTLTLPSPQAPGLRSFETLVESIARTQRSRADSQLDPRRLATLLWATLHGLVSLRISRPNYPWPPLEEEVTTAVERIAGLRASAPLASGR
jgi:AcrR family transcriptional regulator